MARPVANRRGILTRVRDRVGQGDHARSFWSDRKISLGLFAGVLIVYLAVMRGKIEIYDTEAMLGVTENLVRHGSFHAAGADFSLATVWSPYGIGVSLLAVPLYALSMATGHFSILVSLINPLVTATCVVLIYKIARTLDWTPAQGLIASLAFGLPSFAVWYSLELLSEPEVTFCILLVVLEIVRWRQGSRSAPLILGLALAAAIQFRSDSVFTVGVAFLTLPLFVPSQELFSKRAVVRLVPPVVASFAFLLWYDEIRFGSLLVFGYGPNDRYDTPLLHGLNGLLFSPGAGLFIYAPLTALGVIGLALIIFGPKVETGPRLWPLGRTFDRSKNALLREVALLVGREHMGSTLPAPCGRSPVAHDRPSTALFDKSRHENRLLLCLGSPGRFRWLCELSLGASAARRVAHDHELSEVEGATRHPQCSDRSSAI
jgi:hypothetical protein